MRYTGLFIIVMTLTAVDVLHLRVGERYDVVDVFFLVLGAHVGQLVHQGQERGHGVAGVGLQTLKNEKKKKKKLKWVKFIF